MSMIVNVLKNVLEKRRIIGRYSIQELLYRIALEQELQHFENRDKGPIVSVSVTDLVACSQRYHFVRRYPEIKIQMNYNPILVLGRILHVGLETIIRSQWHDVETEKPIEKIISLDDGRVIRVAGVVDAYVPGESLVIEFKTSRADHELPLQHHVLQLKIYMNMLQAEHGLLFYINPDRISEYAIDNSIDDWQLQALVNETLNNQRHPRYDWECNYCPYSIMCPYKKLNKYKR